MAATDGPGGGGNPYVGLEKGSYAYTGGVGDLVSGSREGAGFLSSQTLQQMAWAPRHYWSKDKINGTRIDSSGNYVAHTTLVGNNSWGSQPYETGRPFTAAGLASITMPGGGGALGGGGGGGLASILGGNLSGFGGLGSSSNNNQNQGSPRPNPLDEPALRACLADICSDIAAQQLEIPQSCKDVSFAVASTSQAGQEKDVDGQSNETVKSTTTANSVDEDRLARLLKRVRQDTARRRVEFSRASGAH